MEGERKSVEPMSERVNVSERSMQRLLTEVKWDEQEVIQTYRRLMLAETSDAQGVLAIDDTGFPKKGKHSACVSRQYCGPTGKVDNCQVGVSLTYVGQDVAWPYCMKLFVPEKWDNFDDSDCIIQRTKTRHRTPSRKMAHGT
jgi:SRSO17 transposase